MHLKISLALKVLFTVTSAQLLLACESDFFSGHKHSMEGSAASLNSEAPSNKIVSNEANKLWEVSQLTEKEVFSVKLSCLKHPYVGDFQDCRLSIKQGNQSVSDAVISIDGGMQAHGHGLPTSPKLNPTELAGQYKIEGLKFSMLGEWVLGFRISANQLTDQAIFKLSI